jgi:hypothetical protein
VIDFAKGEWKGRWSDGSPQWTPELLVRISLCFIANFVSYPAGRLSCPSEKAKLHSERKGRHGSFYHRVVSCYYLSDCLPKVLDELARLHRELQQY